MVYKIQQEVKGGDDYSEDEIIRDAINFSKKLILWGLNNVIKKWLVFRNRSVKKNMPAEETLFMLEDIIFEIKKRYGTEKKWFKTRRYLELFYKRCEPIYYR